MFVKEVLLFVAVYITAICAEPPVPQYGVPFNNNGQGNVGQTGNYQGGGYNSNGDYGNYNGQYSGQGQQDHDHSQAMSYEFGYQVKDDYSGNDYGRQEKSDGNQVQGEYRVQLPDGRTQIVTYYADWQTGFHADVRYEGEAQYPDQYNNNNNNNGYNNPGNQYTPPVISGGTQGYNNNNYNNNNYDNQNYNNNNGGSGYNYNTPSNNGYNNVNDGVNFGNYDSNRNKPTPVYGAP
nr:pro-resilin-like [Onthophagus taurus]